MSARELLELAAKAAGIETPKKNGPWFWLDNDGLHKTISGGGDGTRYKPWNPLTDDADAFRLGARLNINVYYRENINGAFVIADHAEIEFCPESLDGPDECAATRRAIVRAAAAIGEQMP